MQGKRKGAVIVVQADSGSETPKRVAAYLAQILRDLNVETVGTIAEGGIGNPGDAAKKPDLLERAREVGRKMAEG